ncbi:hypothetical protein R20233_03577 [Ralstonia sp. LMG 32965]|nr:hypothetical protein R20233_03577 [Ralstonia sp. LMG 32965]
MNGGPKRVATRSVESNRSRSTALVHVGFT